jgi:hypothetical protein
MATEATAKVEHDAGAQVSGVPATRGNQTAEAAGTAQGTEAPVSGVPATGGTPAEPAPAPQAAEAAETAKPATPAEQSAPSVAELAAQVKVLADTLAAAPPAGADLEKRVAELVDAKLALLEARRQAAAEEEVRAAARQRVLDELAGLGVPAEVATAAVPAGTAGAEALAAAKAAAIARWNEIGPKKADVGGARQEGGAANDASAASGAASRFANLSPGTAAFAAALKI